jgi:hypothetical protein
MAPFTEAIPEDYNRSIVELVKGEKRLYDFMETLYSSMYDSPDQYHIPTREYENLMKSRTVEELSADQKKKESTIRNSFLRSIQFYQKMLFEIGANGVPVDGKLRVKTSLFEEMINRNNLRVVRGEHEKIMEGLSRNGLMFSKDRRHTYVEASDHPNLLRALRALCRFGTRTYRMTNFLRCDFRGMVNNKPGFNDVVAILGDKYTKNAEMMDGFMNQMKAKIKVQPLKNTTLGSVWKTSYVKGKSIYGFQADPCWMEAYVYFNEDKNIKKVGYHLKETDPVLYEWYYSNFKEQECACQYNRRVDIGGEKKRICGFSNRLVVTEPDTPDFEKIKRTIQVFREMSHTHSL